MSQLDLDAYFARIGYAGPRTPEFSTVQAIHALHPAAIPFEGLDPLLGRRVALDLASLQAKLVHGRRGGYCFEQNALFAAVLAALGLAATELGARVRWMAPPDHHGPRTHMLLHVDFPEGPYLLDVGFGGYLLSAPVRLEHALEQSTPSGTVRVMADGPSWTMQAKLQTGWQDLYRFTLEPQLPADHMVGNWFTSAHPESIFTNNLLVQRLAPEGRINLLNNRLTLRGYDGVAEERTLTGPGELREVLETVFAITPPADPADIWDRLPKS